jgi:hypothetical protein
MNPGLAPGFFIDQAAFTTVSALLISLCWRSRLICLKFIAAENVMRTNPFFASKPEMASLGRRRFLLGAVLLAAVPVLATQVSIRAHAGSAPKVYTGYITGVGAGGYDVVAYFTDGKPTKGDPAFTAEHNGASWRFASVANRDLFMADPAKYAPQYGGHCAYAAAKGYVAKGDPEAWTVHDGKLYLNYSDQVRASWLTDIAGNIAAAESKWPGLLQ